MNALRRLSYGLIALAAVQVMYYYPQMPEVVASHFGGAGAPNGRSSRNAFFAIYLSMLALLVMIIMGVVHLLLAIFTVQLAIMANLGQDDRLHSSIGWALGLYFLFIIAWLVHFWRHFSKT